MHFKCCPARGLASIHPPWRFFGLVRPPLFQLIVQFLAGPGALVVVVMFVLGVVVFNCASVFLVVVVIVGAFVVLCLVDVLLGVVVVVRGVVGEERGIGLGQKSAGGGGWSGEAGMVFNSPPEQRTKHVANNV